MLSFPLNREGWDEYLEFMREIEVDYEEQAQTSLERNRENMLALLPSSLHPYIHDGTINRPYKPADWYMEEFELIDGGFAISILLEKTQGEAGAFIE